MRRQRWIQISVALVGVICLSIAGSLVWPINKQRASLQLTLGDKVGETVPPEVALGTMALGSFRGLLIDYLWHRANKLQEEGELFEANQLSQFITTLQPRFPQVWAFQAWNMAYNISVMTDTPEERWDWVSKGVNLLRDQGIPYNPNAVRLYRELGWIFFHKIGQFTDDMHWYYKRQMALEWQQVLGQGDFGGTTEEVISRFRPIAEAPETLDALLAQSPDIEPVIARLRDLGYELDETFLMQAGLHAMFLQSIDVRIIGIDLQKLQVGSFDEKLLPFLEDETIAPAREAMLAYLRRKTLTERYHMDAVHMLGLMEMFGPVDWRHPAAHCLYWSSLGVQRIGTLLKIEGVDTINSDRQVIHALQLLEHSGRLTFDPVSQHIDIIPDPRFVPAYDKAVEAAYKRIEEQTYRSDTTFTFQSGHENFLQKAVYDYYLYGDLEEANKYYTKVRDLYGNLPHNVESGRFLQSLDDFILLYIEQNLDMMSNTQSFISMMLQRGFREGLANQRYEVYERRETLARRIHKKFQKRAVDKAVTEQDRMSLLPFEKVVENNYITYMRSTSVPLPLRARIWYSTPDALRRSVYDRLAPVLYEQALLAMMNPSRVFPTPEGLEEQREAILSALQKKYQQAQEPVQIERQ